MSRHRRGRFTVQYQPTGAARGIRRGMGVVQAIFGLTFVVVALTQIIPNAGLFGLPFLAIGGLFLVMGIVTAVSKNAPAQRVGYDLETDVEEETIVGMMDEVIQKNASPENDASRAPGTAEERLKELRSLYDQRLITQEEYEQKRQEILRQL